MFRVNGCFFSKNRVTLKNEKCITHESCMSVLAAWCFENEQK